MTVRFAFRGASSAAYKVWCLLRERGPMPVAAIAVLLGKTTQQLRAGTRNACFANVIYTDFDKSGEWWHVGPTEPLMPKDARRKVGKNSDPPGSTLCRQVIALCAERAMSLGELVEAAGEKDRRRMRKTLSNCVQHGELVAVDRIGNFARYIAPAAPNARRGATVNDIAAAWWPQQKDCSS